MIHGQTPPPGAVPNTQPFTVTLQAQEWNAVLAAMSKATYEQAAPLIQAIGAQLQDQAAQQLPAGNGAIMHPTTN